MNRKFTFLAFVAMILATVVSFAVVPSCTIDSANAKIGMNPHQLPKGCIDTPYEEVLQIKLPTDTTVNYQGQEYSGDINSISILSVSGIDTLGLTYGCNSPDCKIMVDKSKPYAYGCLVIVGMPTDTVNDSLEVEFNLNVSTEVLIGINPITGKPTYATIPADVKHFEKTRILIRPFEECMPDVPVGFSENTISFNVSPVPASDAVTVDFEGNGTIVVSNLSGASLISISGQGATSVNTSSLLAGTYILSVTTETGTAKKKIIIE